MPNLIPNCAFVLVSPSGWSGTCDRFGNPVEFAESQVYLFGVDNEGEFQGMTIRTGMDLEQNNKFLSLLSDGEYIPTIDTGAESIKCVVDSVVLVRGENMEALAQKVLARISEALGTEVLITDEKGDRAVSEARENIRNIKDLHIVDSKIGEVLEEFEMTLRRVVFDLSEDSLRVIIEENGRAVLEMQAIIDGNGNKRMKGRHKIALEKVQKITGCVGRGVLKKGEKKLIRRCGKCGALINCFLGIGDACPVCRGIYRC